MLSIANIKHTREVVIDIFKPVEAYLGRYASTIKFFHRCSLIVE